MPAKTIDVLTIEELAAELQIPQWQLAGLKQANGWGAGKSLTRAEFENALSTWLGSPMHGGEKTWTKSKSK